MNTIKKTTALLLSLLILTLSAFTVFAESYSVSYLNTKINAVIDFELSYTNTTDLNNYSSTFLAKNAGTSFGDWFTIALKRNGARFNVSAYLSNLDTVLNGFYSNGISNAKITDLQRIALAYTACGKDIKNIQGHNLLSDCSYGRDTTELSTQGINTLAYALIVIDSCNFYVPKNTKSSRDTIINEILSLQLADGGFALSGNYADADTTAIVINALAPYVNKKSNVATAVNTALEKLSKMQKSDGTYSNYGVVNCESTAQVAVALCSLGIDPEKDNRFIKNGKSTIDALLTYQLSNGGFMHILGKNANQMATYQALYTLVAYKSFLDTNKPLFDFSDNSATVEPVTESTYKTPENQNNNINSNTSNSSQINNQNNNISTTNNNTTSTGVTVSTQPTTLEASTSPSTVPQTTVSETTATTKSTESTKPTETKNTENTTEIKTTGAVGEVLCYNYISTSVTAVLLAITYILICFIHKPKKENN